MHDHNRDARFAPDELRALRAELQPVAEESRGRPASEVLLAFIGIVDSAIMAGQGGYLFADQVRGRRRQRPADAAPTSPQPAG